MRALIVTELEARILDICPACGQAKSFPGLVCWECFKRREWSNGAEPLKYACKDFSEWLGGLPADPDLEKRIAGKLAIVRGKSRATAEAARAAGFTVIDLPLSD